MNSKSKTSVLFVCMGNICRSPTAEGVFRHRIVEAGLQEQIIVDSAGTHAYTTSAAHRIVVPMPLPSAGVFR
jgi:protein-tyrosine-phosphatase